ncbi:YagK/YfjJ domain-containing protein [Psychrosphaera algicola]|uniref:Inovirus-type Gp2 protein n=1 Tax=Psychrosphaera algicola TaxID=3023714 RepID=A0ABT5FD42_9GAMM|nr:inovirus-type Gp2 protein [Psychrosphaera sp. G1-22]MDC2888515.1 inovirus-type Gp2 protein [Psychrosphaera sp. G1-22]
MIYKYKRALFMSTKFHVKAYTPDNSIFSNFIKRLKKRLEFHYGSTDFGYVWVRECSNNGNIHYHLVWMIDGDLARTPHYIHTQMEEAWASTNGYFSYSKYHFIDCRESLENALYHGSYITKARTKGVRPDQTKDYGSSRLAFKSKYEKG